MSLVLRIKRPNPHYRQKTMLVGSNAISKSGLSLCFVPHIIVWMGLLFLDLYLPPRPPPPRPPPPPPPLFNFNFVTLHLSHTSLSQSLSHLFVTHHLSHTIFVTFSFTHHLSPLCHTPSFTHNFVAHHLCHTPSLSHRLGLVARLGPLGPADAAALLRGRRVTW